MRLSLLLALAACGDNLAQPDAAPPTAPPLRNPVDLDDASLALAAARVLGADVANAEPASCNTCHGLTKRQLQSWRALTDSAIANCLTDLAVTSQASALAMIDCMRADAANPASDFQAKKLGIFATAAQLPWFAYTFDVAYGSDAPAQLAALDTLAAMPRDAPPLTQQQFDLVAEWFVRGLPALEQTLPGAEPPTTCIAAVDAAVATHVATMATQGWAALDAQANLAMHGCGAATDPHDCLQSYPRATTWEVAGRGVLRVLADESYGTLFWTRSSADGRFVAHGVASVPGSYVIDLQRGATVPIAAEFDPAFFPDNAGFVFQGAQKNTCPLSVLTANPAAITMDEPGCRDNDSIGLYEHLGRLGPAGDHVALGALFVTDDGGKLPTLADPPAQFGATARSTFTPLVFDGSRFLPRATQHVATPYEGDTVLSPSARLTIARFAGPDDRQLGFVLRGITMTPSGTTYMITTNELARYCLTGGKPAFSYDERWAVFHHYVGADDAVELGFSGAGDPAFAPYLSQGAANVYLLDLSTGTHTRITNVGPGAYALFPHFRADGWIYMQVRDLASGHEQTLASDAAL